jgi:L-histidine N-alpha-methyltransferase
MKPATPGTMKTAAQETERENFLHDVVAGLDGKPKSIPSRYFYDAAGSALFEAIMSQPEYYLTRCEAEILSARRGDILGAMGNEPFYLLDLGAGNGEKTRLLLDNGGKRDLLLGYVPVDISLPALRSLEDGLRRDLPWLRVRPLAGSYLPALERFRPPRPGRKLALFLGSNIGNFDRLEALRFLQALRDRLDDGDMLLIGFDLRKDPEAIRRAYSDAAGVTARFNLNLLERINRELGGEFLPETFRHQAVYDAKQGVARSYLISLHDQKVRIGRAGRAFAFEEGESLHTEDSFKYSEEEIERMARIAGFEVAAHFTDKGRRFVDSLWRVKPEQTDDWRLKP